MGVHLLISGRVQGVGYRAWLQQAAQAAGLSGWVRNRHDGQVEAVLIGPRQVVEEIADACWLGPAGARVVEIVREPWASETPNGFSVAPTA